MCRCIFVKEGGLVTLSDVKFLHSVLENWQPDDGLKNNQKLVVIL
jgi:hypothetical protein